MSATLRLCHSSGDGKSRSAKGVDFVMAAMGYKIGKRKGKGERGD